MSRQAKVPASGSNVFRSDESDTRPVYLVPVGGVLLRVRFPLFVARQPPKPIRTSVITMAGRYVPGSREMMADPYKTLPLEP